MDRTLFIEFPLAWLYPENCMLSWKLHNSLGNAQTSWHKELKSSRKRGVACRWKGRKRTFCLFYFSGFLLFSPFYICCFFFEDSKRDHHVYKCPNTHWFLDRKGWKQSGTALNMGDVILLKAITSARDFVADEQIPQWLETVGEHMDLNKQQMTRFDNTHISWIIWKNLTELCKNIHKPFSRQQNVISWFFSYKNIHEKTSFLRCSLQLKKYRDPFSIWVSVVCTNAHWHKCSCN